MNSEIANRYARAFFRTGSENNLLEKHAKCFEAIAPLLRPASQFLHWIAAPQIPQNVKMEALERHFAGVCDREFMNFLFFLLKKDRFQELPAIAKEYRRLVAKKQGILDVRLITTVAIDESTKDKLALNLKEKFGLVPRIHEEIDPALIGGSVLVIGNKVLDNSIKGKLFRLKKHLLRGTHDYQTGRSRLGD